jgi:glycosyltransferase involved in cell wall biosynthesis
MKVVHLASAGEIGGAEAVILDILAGLRQQQPHWGLELIVPEPGPLQQRAAALGVPVVVIPWGAKLERLGDTLSGRRDLPRIALRMVIAIPAVITYAISLARALSASRATVVHAHGSKMLILGMWARPRNTPLVLHMHDYISQRPIVSRILRFRSRGRAIAAAISRSIAADASLVLGPGIPVEVVYNGIDTKEWTRDGPRMDLDAASGMEAYGSA